MRILTDVATVLTVVVVGVVTMAAFIDWLM